MTSLCSNGHSGQFRFQPSALSNLSFWIEPQALAAFLVAIDSVAASACGSSFTPIPIPNNAIERL